MICIVYDTMWNSTRKMAEAIADGIHEADPDVKIVVCNAGKQDKNDILTYMFRAKAVLVGSPTINSGVSYAIAGILEMAHGLKLRNKKAAAFGSYGWSGEGIKVISKHLQESGFELVNDGLRLLWMPDSQAIDQCRQYGRTFALSTPLSS